MAPQQQPRPPPSPLPLRRSQRLSLYHPSLAPLVHCRSLRSLLQIQSHLTVTSLLSDPFSSSRLLLSSLRLSLPHSLLLFLHLPNPDLFSFNSLLSHLPHSLSLPFFFSHLSPSFPSPNSFTFTSLLKSSCSSHSLWSGQVIHSQSLKRGLFHSSPHVGNSLLHLYSTCGVLDSARKVFDEMSVRDICSWNSMVDGYVKCRELVGAKEVFEGMPERNVVSWNVMVGGFVKGRREREGLELVRRMGREGVVGDVKMVVSAVTGCGRLGWGNGGREVHGVFVRRLGREEGNVILGTALVDMYGKCERVGDARRVFNGMRVRNLVCWNAMIVGYGVNGDVDKGIDLFEEMAGKGEFLPDEVTFVGVLCACARGGLLDEGKKYFDQMKSLYHLKPTFAHYWCMANLYAKLGLVHKAEQVLKSMPEETESLLWSSLLGYCRFQGDIGPGEKIAKALIELEPLNSTRYSLLWNIYMASRRFGDAQMVKEVMKDRGLTVVPDGRLVDLNELVHNFKVRDQLQPEMEKIYTMMDDLAVMLKLPGFASAST